METALTQSSSVRRMSFIKNIIKKDLHGGGVGMGGDSQVIGFLVQIANEGFLSFPPELPCHSKVGGSETDIRVIRVLRNFPKYLFRQTVNQSR